MRSIHELCQQADGEKVEFQSFAAQGRPAAAGIAGLALLGVVLYLVLIFYGYDRADPGWSHSGETGGRA